MGPKNTLAKKYMLAYKVLIKVNLEFLKDLTPPSESAQNTPNL